MLFLRHDLVGLDLRGKTSHLESELRNCRLELACLAHTLLELRLKVMALVRLLR